MSRYEEEVHRRRKQIEEGERGGDPEDRAVLLDLIDRLERDPGKRGDKRRRMIVVNATTFAEQVGGLERILDDRDAVDDLLDWINEAYQPPHGTRLQDGTTSWSSWHDKRKDLRTIGTVLNGGTLPETMEHVSLTTPSDGRSSVDADELPGPAIVRGRMDACDRLRDKAIVATMFEPGLRPMAAHHLLRVGDVTINGERVTITVREDKIDKFTPREVAVLWEPARDALRAYLEHAHPAPDDPSAPLWAKHTTPERLTYRRFAYIVKTSAKDSDTTHLGVSPKLYQKANMRWLRETVGMKLEVINERQGRRRDSDHTPDYLSDHGADAQRRMFEDATGTTLDGAEGDGLAERLVEVGVDDPVEFVEVMATVIENPRAASALLASRNGDGSGEPVDAPGEAADLPDLPQLPD